MRIKIFLIKLLWTICSSSISSVFSLNAERPRNKNDPPVILFRLPLKIPRGGPTPCSKSSSIVLKSKLESEGGYVSGYVAQTKEEAISTFKDFGIFNSTAQSGSSSSQNNDYEHMSNRVHGRRRRSVFKTVTRNADGSNTTIRHCVEKGTETETGNLRLCAVCTATKQLPEDRFPRFINEVLCNNDKKCLSGEGKCAQKSITIKLLKKARTCSLTSDKYRRYYYVEDWEPYDQTISVGCECEVKPRSPLANEGGLVKSR